MFSININKFCWVPKHMQNTPNQIVGDSFSRE